jgi:DNA-binding LacI/PurR family transcriptional regulator
MPGVHWLATELGVNRKTADAALRQLEREGLLVPQGAGRRRQIVLPGGLSASSLRVAILVGEAADRRQDYMIKIQHELADAGHTAFFAEPHMVELGMDVRRIARMVKRTEADAWVVEAGSREMLEWFSTQATPAFALFGRMRQLLIAGAGPEKIPAVASAAKALIGLGHRRIVMLVRPRRRLPKPGTLEQAFLDELAAHGLPSSDYNLPGWEESIQGFHECLDSLFRVTPPTALIIDEVPLFAAAQQFLARRRLRVPENVSLVSMDADASFDWCQPTISHIRWDSRPVVRRVVRWVDNLSHGKPDLRQTLTLAEFVPGGTIGSAEK